MNSRMVIQYDGARYKGWQRQSSGNDTIQGRIEQVLSKRMNRVIQIDGAGRTDAGVHAMAQIANVHLEETLDVHELKVYLNEYLPQDIRIMNVDIAGERFHSRLNATGKVYEYHLLKRDCYDVFRRKYCWQMTEELHLDSMREAAGYLLGEHDFRAFCTKASKKKSTIRRIDAIDMIETEDRIVLHYEGNGFLYNMIRILTGTLVEVGEGKREAASVTEVLRCGQRRFAGETAPAQGLFLTKVKYD